MSFDLHLAVKGVAPRMTLTLSEHDLGGAV
jgi:hypothetical protein